MIYKSFLRKKSTKIYFVVFLLLFIVLIFLASARNYYIEKENYYHRRSYLLIGNKEDIDLSYLSLSGVKGYQKVIMIESNYDARIVLFPASGLNKNDVIISKGYEEDVSIGEKMQLEYNGKTFELKVAGFADNLASGSYFVNEELINEMNKIKPSNLYKVDIINWLKFDKIDKKLTFNDKIDVYSYNGAEIGTEDYKDIFTILTIFFALFIVIFIVVGFFTILNIIHDEKRNNSLYRALGFKNTKIISITFGKVMIVIISAMVLSSLLFLIISYIY